MGERRVVACFILALATSSIAFGSTSAALRKDFASESTIDARALGEYGRLPLLFARFGDPGGTIRFVGHSSGQHVVISPSHLRFAARTRAGTMTTIGLGLAGVDRRARLDGEDPQPTRVHRFRESAALVEAPTYNRVRLSNAYPNVDLVFYGQGQRVEYDVIVEPGGDPSALRLLGEENARFALDDHGNLVVSANDAALTLHRPIAYQTIGGRRIDVDGAFLLTDDGEARIGVGRYDRSQTLVIDPVVTYATYVGGASFDQGTAIAVDAAGNAYIAGLTQSADFPTLSAYDRSLGKSADMDVFVSKLNAAGTALVWSTYLGGASSLDRAVGIAVDATGNVYVTGQTASNNFPVTTTAWQKAIAGGATFITKLGPAGNTLAYSTYVANATSQAIAVDPNGNAFVAGKATPGFLTTPGVVQPGTTAAETGFVLKLNAAGTAPIFSTFIGGSASDQVTSIAIDASGNAYLGGWTTSNDFPVRNSLQSALQGHKDAFIAKLDGSGARLSYSTLLGGSLDDAVNAIAVDTQGFAYVAGETYSSNFPTRNAFQSQKAGARLLNASVGNAFVAKLVPTGDSLVYSSFLGGEVCTTLCQLVFGPQLQFRADAAYGIAIDSAGHALVTGIARSYTFPLVDSASPRKQQDNEDSGFAAKVSIGGNTLLWSTFVRTGYSGSDNHWTQFPPGAATGVAVDSAGAAYVTGDSDTSFQSTPGAFQTAVGQGAIVVKYAPAQAMSLTTSSASVDGGTPVTLTVTLTGPPVGSIPVMFMDGPSFVGFATMTGNTATLTTTLPVGIHSLTAVLRAPGSYSDTPPVLQIVDVPLACD